MIRVVIDDKAIQSFASKTIALGDGRALRELQRGLSDGGRKVRTKVRRALKEQTGVVRYASITSRVDGFLSGPLQYDIRATGKGLPITEFKFSVPGNVQASPWNVSRVFARSFRTSAKGLLRARLASSRFPIRALYGPSMAKELVKDQSLDAFHEGVRTDVATAIHRRLARLMP